MRRFVPFVIASGVVLIPLSALAAKPTPAPAIAAPAPGPADDRARDGGVIEGKVTNVDYSRGVISVDSTTQGKLDVSTMPTTSVQGSDPGYHTLTDVSRGSKVQIFISRTAGKIVAQIIRLVKH